ncbi:MAG: hypothetical protein QM715_01580 [Nibricoccus sp.]
MNIRLSNQLNMIGTCLRVAQSRGHSLVWLGRDPSHFGVDLTSIEAGYKIALGKAALADTAKGGASDVRAQAETTLENAAYVLTRALAVHFRKSNDLDRHAEADLSLTQIVRLRENELIARATAIRDLARVAQAEEKAAFLGITTLRIEGLTQAIEAFDALRRKPRGPAITRSTLLRELETDTAALIEQLRDLDDLVLQFDGSAAGLRFIAAWEKARVIVDRVSAHPFSGVTE